MIPRLLEYFGLKESPKEESALIDETKMLRAAMDRVGDKLNDVAASIREANRQIEESNIPMQDMMRPTRRKHHRELE